MFHGTICCFIEVAYVKHDAKQNGKKVIHSVTMFLRGWRSFLYTLPTDCLAQDHT